MKYSRDQNKWKSVGAKCGWVGKVWKYLLFQRILRVFCGEGMTDVAENERDFISHDNNSISLTYICIYILSGKISLLTEHHNIYRFSQKKK